MTWRDAVEAAVRRHAARCDGGVFTRQDFLSEEEARIVSDASAQGATPRQTISRVLQELRNANVISFLDDRGTYQLAS